MTCYVLSYAPQPNQLYSSRIFCPNYRIWSGAASASFPAMTGLSEPDKTITTIILVFLVTCLVIIIIIINTYIYIYIYVHTICNSLSLSIYIYIYIYIIYIYISGPRPKQIQYAVSCVMWPRGDLKWGLCCPKKIPGVSNGSTEPRASDLVVHSRCCLIS